MEICKLCAFAALLCVSIAKIVPSTERFKIYGNWCGPRHGGGPAEDALDDICKTHDLCYARYGYFNCFCDKNFIKSVGLLSNFKLRAIGTAMVAYLEGSPCKAPVQRPGFCGRTPCLKCSDIYIATSLKMTVKRYTCNTPDIAVARYFV